ncbi:MAG: hypothetical protein AAF667_08705 [Pseudomonadota bacterium]
MSEFLPKEVRDGLKEAHLKNIARKSRFRLHTGDRVIPIVKLWNNGFSLQTDGSPQIRGLVDLFDGTRHIAQCLVFASSEEDGVTEYEFKRTTRPDREAPRDYAVDPAAPVALIENG